MRVAYSSPTSLPIIPPPLPLQLPSPTHSLDFAPQNRVLQQHSGRLYLGSTRYNRLI